MSTTEPYRIALTVPEAAHLLELGRRSPDKTTRDLDVLSALSTYIELADGMSSMVDTEREAPWPP